MNEIQVCYELLLLIYQSSKNEMQANCPKDLMHIQPWEKGTVSRTPVINPIKNLSSTGQSITVLQNQVTATQFPPKIKFLLKILRSSIMLLIIGIVITYFLFVTLNNLPFLTHRVSW